MSRENKEERESEETKGRKRKENKGEEKEEAFCSVKRGKKTGEKTEEMKTCKMWELKDPTIKLFGKTISSPRSEAVSNATDGDRYRDQQSSSITGASLENKDKTGGELNGSKQEDDSGNPAAEEYVEPETVSGISDDHKSSGTENETSSPKILKEDSDENNLSQEKMLKKPDKILPCPRCNSSDTKFCYYNNYNVNQPRHFCKKCQRYWTAGGSMRNVPVGSGRRKNKNTSTTNYRHLMISDALHGAHAGAANGIHLPTLKANGTILSFGTERPLCESVATVLNLAERSHNHLQNGCYEPEQKIAIPCIVREIAADHSNGSSSTTTNSTGNGASAESVLKNRQGGYLPHVPPPFQGPSWPSPRDSAQWRTPLPRPVFSPSGFPVSFYPAGSYWGCTGPSTWKMPWLSPRPSSPDHSVLSTSPSSPTLGKHSRNGFILNPSNLVREERFADKNEESCILTPKTLRFDDPNEAAKSSIWLTLGIKNEKSDTISGARLFNVFPLKGDKKNRLADTSLVLQANPAAFSRSQNFQERT